MKLRSRDLTEKYKDARLKNDCLYSSRVLNTFFNKFTKKGKKALSFKLLMLTFRSFRFYFRRPSTKFFLFSIFRNLRRQFLLQPRRKSKVILYVPTPIRRNRRDLISANDLYKAINKRKERTLREKILQELQTTLVNNEQSTIFKEHFDFQEAVYEERVNADYR